MAGCFLFIEVVSGGGFDFVADFNYNCLGKKIATYCMQHPWGLSPFSQINDHSSPITLSFFCSVLLIKQEYGKLVFSVVFS
jgi:hypothetical protein